MEPARFEAELLRDGFTDIATKSLPHAPPNTEHAHEFDVRALVLEGAITLTTTRGSRTYRQGDVFVMERGREHTEAVEASGVRYVFGCRRSQDTAPGPARRSVGPEDEARGGHEAPGEAGPTVPGTEPKPR